MKIIEKEIVLKSEKRQVCYYSVIQNGDDIVLYENHYVLHKGKFLYTNAYKSKDGVNFDDAILIHSENCLSHNFSVFKGIDGNIYGIGGMDSWKNNKTWHDADTFDKFKILFQKKYRREYERNEDRYKKAHDRLINEKWLLDYSDGLYLFRSSDGVDFKPVYDDPIVNVDQSGFNSALQWKSTEFDGHISCMHDGEKYILYVRNNIQKGNRFIQYSTSKDLRFWSEFNNIKMNPEFDQNAENYYFPCFLNIDGRFLGILPYYTDTKACLRFVESFDGVSWNVKHEFFIDIPIIIEDKKKNFIHSSQGIVRKDGKLYIYIHCNYMGHDSEDDVYIKRCELEL